MKATLVMLAIGCAVAIVSAALFGKQDVSKANFDLVTKGMSKSEVARILGGHSNLALVGERHHGWRGLNGIIIVEFDERGQLFHKIWTERTPTFREKLDFWLRWFDGSEAQNDI